MCQRQPTPIYMLDITDPHQYGWYNQLSSMCLVQQIPNLCVRYNKSPIYVSGTTNPQSMCLVQPTPIYVSGTTNTHLCVRYNQLAYMCSVQPTTIYVPGTTNPQSMCPVQPTAIYVSGTTNCHLYVQYNQLTCLADLTEAFYG